jgi:ketosteroid isomerase-like protein
MLQRRVFLASTLSPLAFSPMAARAQGTPAESEAAVRRALAQFLAAWNRHDLAAWSEMLSTDVHWVFPNSNSKRSRDVVATYGSQRMRIYDVDFSVRRIKLHDNDTRATLTLGGQERELPVRDGKYVRIWNRDLLLTRWRLEDAHWRLYYWNDNTFESAALAKEEGLE